MQQYQEDFQKQSRINRPNSSTKKKGFFDDNFETQSRGKPQPTTRRMTKKINVNAINIYKEEDDDDSDNNY